MSFEDTCIRFGVIPGRNQTPSERCLEKGINLCRSNPEAINITVSPQVIQPNYSVYKDNLPLFITSAINGTWVKPRGSKYAAISYPSGLATLPISYPALYISWKVAPSDETKALLRAKGWRDGMAKGSHCMVHDTPTEEQYREVRDYGPMRTTPAPQEGVNLSAFQKCVVINRLACSFLRVHQYPAFIDQDHAESFSKHFEYVVHDSLSE